MPSPLLPSAVVPEEIIQRACAPKPGDRFSKPERTARNMTGIIKLPAHELTVTSVDGSSVSYVHDGSEQGVMDLSTWQNLASKTLRYGASFTPASAA